MPRKRVTPEIEQEIARLHKLGLIDDAIADRIGFSSQTVFMVRAKYLGLRANGGGDWRPGYIKVVSDCPHLRPRIEKVYQEAGVTVTRYASASPMGYNPTRMQDRDWGLGL